MYNNSNLWCRMQKEQTQENCTFHSLFHGVTAAFQMKARNNTITPLCTWKTHFYSYERGTTIDTAQRYTVLLLNSYDSILWVRISNHQKVVASNTEKIRHHISYCCYVHSRILGIIIAHLKLESLSQYLLSNF